MAAAAASTIAAALTIAKVAIAAHRRQDRHGEARTNGYTPAPALKSEMRKLERSRGTIEGKAKMKKGEGSTSQHRFYSDCKMLDI